MTKRPKTSELTETLVHATDGLIGTVTDLVLAEFFFLLLLPGKQSPYSIHRAAEDAYNLVDYHINYQTIKRAIHHLTKKGLVKRSKKRTVLEIEITELGKKRIDMIFPVYQTKRPWDGHIYLVSYDIPVKANRTRNLLREYLRRTGSALLQESLWISPYNPTKLLEEFSSNHKLTGTILVSKLGQDGTIGEETLAEMILRVYKLDHLTKQYEEFIKMYSNTSNSISPLKLSLDYFSILKKDPQLPFELLPKDFPESQAYDIFRRFFPS